MRQAAGIWKVKGEGWNREKWPWRLFPPMNSEGLLRPGLHKLLRWELIERSALVIIIQGRRIAITMGSQLPVSTKVSGSSSLRTYDVSA